MKSAFSTFDIIKFKSTASVASPEYFNYYGIVRESDNINTFAEWVFSKNSKESKEVLGDIGWVKNSDVEKVGSLFHMLDRKLTVATVVAPVISAPVANTAAEVSATEVSAEIVAPVERVKRKYTRKPGSAKPGPKPKASKVAQEDTPATDVKSTIIEENASPAASKVVYVDRPTTRYGRAICADHWNDVVVTGKFDAFPCREKMLDLIRNHENGLCWRLSTRINWDTDFAIVGKKPGPAKIEKFKQYCIPTITEEQFLAFIGSVKYKFKDEMTPEEKAAMAQTA